MSGMTLKDGIYASDNGNLFISLGGRSASGNTRLFRMYGSGFRVHNEEYRVWASPLSYPFVLSDSIKMMSAVPDCPGSVATAYHCVRKLYGAGDAYYHQSSYRNVLRWMVIGKEKLFRRMKAYPAKLSDLDVKELLTEVRNETD